MQFGPRICGRSAGVYWCAILHQVNANDAQLHRSILRELGRELRPDSMILDFGCGDGRFVHQYRDSGFQAFGADLILPKQDPLLRLIPSHNYRLPFDDDTFDFVYSNSVLEHVQNLASALSEIRRVLKPGGASLHIFPPKAKPIEPHVFVPFAGIIRNRAWLLLWAAFGIRCSFQKDMSWRQTAQDNYTYLHNHTFYRTRRELREAILGSFCNLVFADREMIKHSYGRARYIAPLAELLPVVASIYGATHNRCIYFEKKQNLGYTRGRSCANGTA